MKQPLALPLVASITCLAAWNADAKPASAAHASAHADKAKAAAEIHAVAPAKAKAPVVVAKGKASVKAKEPVAEEKPAPEKKRVKRSYWLSASPHIPLAEVDESGDLHLAGDARAVCGKASRWAKPKSRWSAVNAWGQLAGAFQIAGSAVDEDTSCREVSFEGQRTGDPALLFVSEDSGFTPTASVEWKPSVPDKKRFDRFVGGMERMFLDGKLPDKIQPLSKRTMFFEAKPPATSTLKARTHWAVTGGPVLMVSYLGEHGKWKAAMVEPPLGLAQSYRPVAVFDMNGDGAPEIVFHVREGLDQRERVLSLDADTARWTWATSSQDTPAL
jgi:hypothetical protein